MNIDSLLYLLPYLISLTISLGVGVLLWRRHIVPGARAYALATFIEASMTLGYIFEFNAVSLAGKVFWDNIQFIGILTAPLALLAFAINYTGYTVRYSRPLWIVLFTLAFVNSVLVFTDPVHHLVRPEERLVPGTPFSELDYPFGVAAWGVSGFTYAVLLIVFYLLIKALANAQRIFRQQLLVILIGMLPPMLGELLILADVRVSFHRDTSPLMFAARNLIVTWGLFHFRLFDLIPVARTTVIENMVDPVIVVDRRGRLVDLNPAALAVLRRPAVEVIGRSMDEVFEKWSDFIDRFRDVERVLTEAVVEVDGEQRFLEVTISPLNDQWGELTGRVAILRNITARRRAEEALKERTAQLEIVNRESPDR